MQIRKLRILDKRLERTARIASFVTFIEQLFLVVFKKKNKRWDTNCILGKQCETTACIVSFATFVYFEEK